MNPSNGSRWVTPLLAALLFMGLPVMAQAQDNAVLSGTVTDAETGQPMTGVQVEVADANRSTITDADGSFELENLPAGDFEVRVSLLGYATHTEDVTLQANEMTAVDFELEQSVIDVEELVVTGVAVETERRNLPFSVSQVRAEDMPVPSATAGGALLGRVAGARVTTSSGRPGTSPDIMLRGPTSINASGRSQDPLYIVDGVILSASLVDLDAMDIENIEVVSGAAAASLYGSRAANGVVQITTRRGDAMGEDQVEYTVRNEFGRSELPGRFNLTDRHQFALTDDGQFIDSGGDSCEWLHCSSVQLAGQRALDGQSANAFNTVQKEEWPGVTYDHVDRFFTGGDFLHSYVSAAGRSGATNFHVSYSRQDDQGILPFHRGSLRHNFRVNVDQGVRDDLTLSASATVGQTRTQTQQGNMFQLTRMPAGVDLMADDPFTDADMVIKPDPFNDNVNPLYTMSTSESIQNRSRYLGSVNLRWEPLDWLSFDSDVSYDRLHTQSNSFRPKGYYNINWDQQDGFLSRPSNIYEGVNASGTVTAQRSYGDLDATLQGRYLIEREDQQGTSVSGSGFVADQVWTLSNIPNDNISGGSSLQPTRADGAFLISNFVYRDRYTVDALLRQDGSSRFGPGERRHMYYRLAGGYRIAQEEWFNVRGIDDLNISYSLGTAGNTPNFSAQYETYSVSAGSISPSTLGNRNLKPEQATEHEFRVTSLLFDRLSAEITYSRSEVTDQLLQPPALAFTGFSSQWQNAGTLQSNTLEMTFDANIIQRPDFTWSTRVLYDHTRQEITELGVPPYQTGVSGQGLGDVFYVREGEALGTFYGFQFAEHCGHLPEGVSCDEFDVNDDGFLVYVGDAGSWENGWDTFTDEDGEQQQYWGSSGEVDGQEFDWGLPFQGEDYDPATGERTTFLPLGEAMPDFSIGWSNSINWGNWSFYGLVEAMQGFDVYNQPLQWATFQNYSGIMNEAGTPEELQKPVGYYDEVYGASGLQPSSRFIEDGSFIKLREVQVSYRAQEELLDRVPGLRALSGVTLSVTGRNLFTHSDYDGYDPDVGSSGGGTGSAALARVDGFSAPPFRTVTLGVEVNF